MEVIFLGLDSSEDEVKRGRRFFVVKRIEVLEVRLEWYFFEEEIQVDDGVFIMVRVNFLEVRVMGLWLFLVQEKGRWEIFEDGLFYYI